MLYVNLFITMLLSGLWHGANWTFVVWGLFVAIALSLEKLLGPPIRKFAKKHNWNLKATWILIIKRLIVFVCISISVILFRAQSLQQSGEIVSRIFTKFLDGGIANTITYLNIDLKQFIFIILVLIIAPFLPKMVEEKQFKPADKLFTLKNVTFFIGVVCICLSWFSLISGNAESAFVYFQF